MKQIKVEKLFVIGMIMFSVQAAFAAKGFNTQKSADAYYCLNNVKFDRQEAYMSLSHGAAIEAMELYAADKVGHHLDSAIPAAADTYTANKTGVYKYGTAVITEKYQVKVLRDQAKKATQDKDHTMLVKTRRKLAKAKLDLFRDELHFIIDREALRQDYMLTLADEQKKLATDQAALARSKADLNKELKAGNDEGLLVIYNQIAIKEKEIKADKMAIAATQAKLKQEMKSADVMMK